MRKLLSVLVIGVLAGMSLAVPFAQRASAAPGSYYDWVSRDTNGGELDNTAGEVMQGVSSDGRYVLFASAAADVVPNDTNGYTDLFRRDRQTGTTTIVSVSSSGQLGDNDSFGGTTAAISGDGRYVVFMSRATNLVANDTNSADEVFLRDIQAGTTTRICGDFARGCNSGSISRDGQYITYGKTDPFAYGGIGQLFRYERATGERQLVSENSSQAPGNQNTPAESRLSSDGRYVAFASYANNLVADDTNNQSDIFRRDMQTGDVVRISTSTSGEQATGGSFWPTMSDDGRYITFRNDGTNLVPNETASADYFVKDVTSGSLQLVGGTFNAARVATISGDGMHVVFDTLTPGLTASDTNTDNDAFSWNRVTNTNIRLSDFTDTSSLFFDGVNVGGTSIDGRYTSFFTLAPLDPSETLPDRGDVYVHAIDIVRPTVTFTAPSSFAGPFPTGPTVTVTASDSDSGLKIFVIHVYTSANQLLNICGTATPAELAAGSKTCDLSSLPAGTYYIKAGAFDKANNNRTINSGNFTITGS